MPNPSFDPLNTLQVLAPELILIGTACVMLLLGPFLAEGHPAPRRLSRRWTLLSLIAMGTAGWATFQSAESAEMSGPFIVDSLSTYVRGLMFCVGPILALLATKQVMGPSSAEGHVCLLLVIAGVNVTALAGDLVGMFLGLELVSIPTYLYLYLPRRDAAMQEATIKYFLLSVMSAAVTLYGMAWLYGAAGSTNLGEIADHFSAGPAGDVRFATLALAIITAGLCFRLSAAPFHFYAPDVFQGVNSASAALLSVAPKVTGFVALVRLVPLVAGGVSMSAAQIPAPIHALIAMLAVVTMTWGNLLALRQTRLHRLLAYSSIAHSGYMLVALAAGEESPIVGGMTSLWFYLAIYGVTTVGLFGLLAATGGSKQLQRDTELAGLSQTNPALAALVALCLISLAGIPPTAGFNGKLQVLLASWGSGAPWGKALAAAVVINSAIAAYYYLRLVALMYFEAPPEGETRRRVELAPAIGGGLCVAATVAVFASPQWLLDLAARL